MTLSIDQRWLLLNMGGWQIISALCSPEGTKGLMNNEAAAEAYLLAQRPPAGSGITGILAAADKIESRIVAAEKAQTALEEIKRLHAPMVMPIDDHLLLLCDHCCFDDAGQQTDDCANSHEHSVDGPACHTAEIIAKADL